MVGDRARADVHTLPGMGTFTPPFALPACTHDVPLPPPLANANTRPHGTPPRPHPPSCPKCLQLDPPRSPASRPPAVTASPSPHPAP